MRKPISAALLCALALAACSREAALPAASAASAASASAGVCAVDGAAAAIRSALQKAVADAAKEAGTQARGMVDVAKMSAAAARLEVQAGTPVEQGQGCRTEIALSIPADMLADAEKYAPLLNGKTPEAVFAAAGLPPENGVLKLPMRLSKDTTGKPVPDAGDVRLLAQTLTDALLPFAVKETVMQRGKPIGRDEALRRLNNPLSEPAASEPAPAEVPPADEAPDEAGNTAPAASAPEVLRPQTRQNQVSAQELENARRDNEEAGSSIRSVWQAIAPEIQSSLVDEQKSWEAKKQQSCRNAGAKGADRAEAQYLQIQCDTRLTRERVQYLKGYSIQ